MICNQCTEHKVEDATSYKNNADQCLSTFQFINTRTNIDLSSETNRIQNLKYFLDLNSMSSFNALGKFIKNSFKKGESLT